MNWTELTRLNSMIDAIALRAYLEAHGIEVFIPSEHTKVILNHTLPSLGFVALQVPADQLNDAQDLLQEYNRQASQVGYDAGDSQYDELKTAHEPMHDDIGKRALRNAIFGTFMVPLVLNLYSVKLLFEIYSSPKKLRQVKKPQIYLAIFFNLIGLAFWSSFVLAWWHD